MLGPTNLPPMEGVPVFESLVLQHPQYGAGLAVVVGLGAWYLLRMRGRGRASSVALMAAGLVAAAVIAAGMAIETDRERAVKLTERFVGAVVASDASEIESLMAPTVRFVSAGSLEREWDGPRFVNAAGNLDGSIVSNSMRTAGVEAAREGLVTVRFRATTAVREDGGATVRSVWECDWSRQASGEWLLTRLECLWLNGLSPTTWAGWLARFLRG